jgi:hypothetical protein
MLPEMQLAFHTTSNHWTMAVYLTHWTMAAMLRQSKEPRTVFYGWVWITSA